MSRNAKIIATIGPACQDEAVLRQLILAGVNVARLNFSHGDYEHFRQIIRRIRLVSESLDQPVTIMQDLQGPKIRVGLLEGDQVELVQGSRIGLVSRSTPSTPNLISVDIPLLHELVHPQDRVLLDDGELELQVIDIRGDQVNCEVVLGGILKSHKGINLPGVPLPVAGFTEKDRRDLEFGLENQIDSIAISFVRTPEDIQLVRNAIAEIDPRHTDIPLIAKIERPEALNDLESIVQLSDGVIVARGDLAVEVSPEKVPIAQKQIIEVANRFGKLVITATQMLESMLERPRPSRAEASDVANAIFDGSDALMLTAETASGKYPLLAVQMMAAIIEEAETYSKPFCRWDGSPEQRPGSDTEDAYYVCQASRELAHDRNVSAICVFTKSGRTAMLMSKARPEVKIIAFTPSREVYQRLNLFWGVEPHLIEHASSIEEMLSLIDRQMIKSNRIQPGEQIVLICGFPVQLSGPANLALLHTIES